MGMWPCWSCDLEGFVQIFIPSAQGGPKRNLVTFGPVAFGEMFETAVLWESWVKGQTTILTSSTHKSLCTHKDNSIFKFTNL